MVYTDMMGVLADRFNVLLFPVSHLHVRITCSHQHVPITITVRGRYMAGKHGLIGVRSIVWVSGAVLCESVTEEAVVRLRR